MTIDTNVNTVKSFVGGSKPVNDATRVIVAPANSRRIRIDFSLDCDILTHCVELYDSVTGGQLIGLLDREFTGVMIRDNNFYTMDKNTIYRGDIYAIIAIGATPYDINVVEYIG